MLIGSSGSSVHVTTSASVTPGSLTWWSAHSGEPREPAAPASCRRTSSIIARWSLVLELWSTGEQLRADWFSA